MGIPVDGLCDVGDTVLGLWVVGARVATGACEEGAKLDGAWVLGLFVPAATVVVGE